MIDEKNKGGRPKRVEGETLRRLSLSLRPSMRLGLELLSRSRNVSMSQACEYAIAVALRDLKIGSDNALQFVERLAASDEFRNTDLVLVLPTEFLTPQERFARDVWYGVEERGRVIMSDQFELWRLNFAAIVLSAADDAYLRGTPLNEAIEEAFAVSGLRSGGLEATRLLDSIPRQSRKAK